jgi:Arc/MetJ family transcription regulator
MRTNIEIDGRLMASAMAAAGLPTKKATVEEALRRLVRQEARRRAIVDMAGLGWEGDLDAMRRDAPRRARR